MAPGSSAATTTAKLVPHQHTLALLSTLRIFHSNDSSRRVQVPVSLILKYWEILCGLSTGSSLLTLYTLSTEGSIDLLFFDHRGSAEYWDGVDLLEDLIQSTFVAGPSVLVPTLVKVISDSQSASSGSDEAQDDVELLSGNSDDLESAMEGGGVAVVNTAATELRKVKEKLDKIMSSTAAGTDESVEFIFPWRDPVVAPIHAGGAQKSPMAGNTPVPPTISIGDGGAATHLGVKHDGMAAGGGATPNTNPLQQAPEPQVDPSAVVAELMLEVAQTDVDHVYVSMTQEQWERAVEAGVKSGTGLKLHFVYPSTISTTSVTKISYKSGLHDELLHKSAVYAYETMLRAPGDWALGPQDNYYYQFIEEHLRGGKVPIFAPTLSWRLAMLMNVYPEQFAAVYGDAPVQVQEEEDEGHPLVVDPFGGPNGSRGHSSIGEGSSSNPVPLSSGRNTPREVAVRSSSGLGYSQSQSWAAESAKQPPRMLTLGESGHLAESGSVAAGGGGGGASSTTQSQLNPTTPPLSVAPPAMLDPVLLSPSTKPRPEISSSSYGSPSIRISRSVTSPQPSLLHTAMSPSMPHSGGHDPTLEGTITYLMKAHPLIHLAAMKAEKSLLMATKRSVSNTNDSGGSGYKISGSVRRSRQATTTSGYVSPGAGSFNVAARSRSPAPSGAAFGASTSIAFSPARLAVPGIHTAGQPTRSSSGSGDFTMAELGIVIPQAGGYSSSCSSRNAGGGGLFSAEPFQRMLDRALAAMSTFDDVVRMCMEGETGAPLALMLLSSCLPDMTDARVALLKGVFDTLACYWRSEKEEGGGSDGTEVVSERQTSRLRRAISTWCSTSALTPLTPPSGQEIIGTFLEAIRCALHRSANSDDDGALDVETGEEDARRKALLARQAELAQVRRSLSGTLLQGHTLLCPNRTVLRTAVDILCSSPRVCYDRFTETCRDPWETVSFHLTVQEELSPSPSSSSSSSSWLLLPHSPPLFHRVCPLRSRSAKPYVLWLQAAHAIARLFHGAPLQYSDLFPETIVVAESESEFGGSTLSSGALSTSTNSAERLAQCERDQTRLSTLQRMSHCDESSALRWCTAFALFNKRESLCTSAFIEDVIYQYFVRDDAEVVRFPSAEEDYATDVAQFICQLTPSELTGDELRLSLPHTEREWGILPPRVQRAIESVVVRIPWCT